MLIIRGIGRINIMTSVKKLLYVIAANRVSVSMQDPPANVSQLREMGRHWKITGIMRPTDHATQIPTAAQRTIL